MRRLRSGCKLMGTPTGHTQNPSYMLTLELRMLHFCNAGGHPLSAAVTILQQSNQVARTKLRSLA